MVECSDCCFMPHISSKLRKRCSFQLHEMHAVWLQFHWVTGLLHAAIVAKEDCFRPSVVRQRSLCRLGNDSQCALQIGYQFMMRWVNNHIYYLKARSPLGKRILEQVADLPFEATGQCCL